MRFKEAPFRKRYRLIGERMEVRFDGGKTGSQFAPPHLACGFAP